MKKIISFDIWDTILKRKCHPEEVKLHTARYLLLKYHDQIKENYRNIYEILKKRNEIEEIICKENQEKNNDAECRIIDVFKRLKEEIFNNDYVDDIYIELLEQELEQEKRVIYINPEILDIFEKYKDLKIYCISDFYMGSSELEQLFKSVSLNIKIEKIYSSADYLLNKRTGRLYKKFHEEIGIKPQEHIHVGDNPYSDIDVAKKMGIETIKIKKEDISFEQIIKDKKFLNTEKLIKSDNSLENRLYNCGIELSPILYFFVYSIVEYAIKNNIDTVNYFTREGETFIKIHEIIKQNNPFSLDIPECKIIEVSRMATFSASLEEISVMELLRLWSQYRKQSISALFKTLGIDIIEYQKYLDKYEIIKDKIVEEPWFDPKIQKLFKDREFSEDMNKQLKIKKGQLLEYFSKKKIIEENKNIFIVDIGWRGTIQDNLAYIFKNKKITGYYFSLYDFYNTQPENTEKISFISDKDIRDKYVAPLITLLEWISNPGTPSVTGYKEGNSIRNSKTDETDVVKKYVLPIQQGIMDGAIKINEYIKIHPSESEEVKKCVYNILKQTKEKPSKDLVNIYYSMVFNDTFGTGEYINKKNKIGIATKFNLIKCRRLLLKESWKEAFIKYNKIDYINIIFFIKEKVIKTLRGN